MCFTEANEDSSQIEQNQQGHVKMEAMFSQTNAKYDQRKS
jgi:hypothetical protein